MKKLIALIALACASFVASAQVPTYRVQTLTIPTVSAGNVSNSIAQVIACGKQQNVTLSWTTGATNVTIRIGASVDGVNYHTNWLVWNPTNALPTTTWCQTTNIATSGLGYLSIDSVLSTGTINATNTVSYGLKISSP